jgi:hypothetical protein
MTMAFSVKAGQIWKFVHRTRGRYVRVEGAGPDQALVTTVIKGGDGKWKSPWDRLLMTKAKLGRFNGELGGFALVEESPCEVRH